MKAKVKEVVAENFGAYARIKDGLTMRKVKSGKLYPCSILSTDFFGTDNLLIKMGKSEYVTQQKNFELIREKHDVVFYPEEALKAWDDIEIQPVNDEYGACEDNEADYWCVNLHQKTGGVETIADLPTKEQAIQLSLIIESCLVSYQGKK